jgi:hypothetical protein
MSGWPDLAGALGEGAAVLAAAEGEGGVGLGERGAGGEVGGGCLFDHVREDMSTGEAIEGGGEGGEGAGAGGRGGRAQGVIKVEAGRARGRR